jgi:outer membrane protein OmpA-like peptidoglycan-associated protein
MRRLPILSAVLVTAANPVFAQVTVDLHALQALPNRPAAASHATRPGPVVVVPNRSAAVTREATATAPNATPAVPLAPQPAMPESVPDNASITPVTPPPPAAGAQPPPPPPVSDKATTAAAPTTTGLRLTFAPGESDLSPDSSASIKQLTQAAPPGDSTTFNVLAYAPGKADDPSSARRVSLSRAMAVRSALVADGVQSARIFVRALGEQYGDGPPDRVDLSVTGANAPTDAAPAKPAPTGAAPAVTATGR